MWKYYVSAVGERIHNGFWLVLLGGVITATTYGWLWVLIFCWHRLHCHLLWSALWLLGSYFLIGYIAETDTIL